MLEVEISWRISITLKHTLPDFELVFHEILPHLTMVYSVYSHNLPGLLLSIYCRLCMCIHIYCFHGSPFQHIHLILHRISWGLADVTISTTTHLGRRSSGPQRISFSCDGDLVELCHPQICPKTFNYMVLSENIVPNRYSISPRRWQSLGKDLGAVSHHQPFCKRQPLKTLKKSWGEYMWGGTPVISMITTDHVCCHITQTRFWLVYFHIFPYTSEASVGDPSHASGLAENTADPQPRH
jgi:hypothetical protein